MSEAADGQGGGGAGEDKGAGSGEDKGTSLAPRAGGGKAGGGDPGKGKGGDQGDGKGAGEGDGKGGKGTPPARPEYVAEKFWDAENGKVLDEQLARSYAALEKRLGGFIGAPAADKDGKVAYELKASDPNVTAILKAEDPWWGAAQEFFAKHNCSQAFVSECLTLQGQIFGAQNQANMQMQQTLLRGQGYSDQRVSQFADRLAAIVGDETYDEIAAEYFRTANGIQIFDRVVLPLLTGGKLPGKLEDGEGGEGSGGDSKEGLQALYAELSKASGPAREAIQKRITAMSKRLAGES